MTGMPTLDPKQGLRTHQVARLPRLAPTRGRELVTTLESMMTGLAAAIRRDRAVDLNAVPMYLDANYLTGAPFQAYATKYAGQKEVIREPLYSYKAYATGGQVQLSFFDQTFGTAINNYGDTNMQNVSSLPAGEAFLATNVRFVPIPAQADYDTAAAGTPVAFGQWMEVLFRNCWLELWILQKPYLRVGPLAMFPSGIGPGTVVAGAATVLRNVSWPNNGQPETNALFLLDPPLLIQPLDNFFVLGRWQAALAVTTAGKAGVVLDGYHFRNVQ